MLRRWRRDRALGRVRPGTGDPLTPYRWWDPLGRALFYLQLPDQQGVAHTYAVDVRYFSENEEANLYLDGRHHASAKLPAIFPVTGGVVEVATTMMGLRRMHYVPDGAPSPQGRALTPDPASLEGYRMRFAARYPRASRAAGAVSIIVLLLALALGLPQIIEQITNIPAVADRVGTFVSSISLPPWLNTALTIAAITASLERATRLRYNWWLDSDFTDLGDLG